MSQLATPATHRPRRARPASTGTRGAICTKTCPVCHCRFVARDGLADHEIFCRECGD